ILTTRLQQFYKDRDQQVQRERLLYVLLLNSSKSYIEANQLDLAEEDLERCPESRQQQWEWRLLKAACTRRRTLLRGHKANVDTIQWRGDGTQVVTASRDGTAIIWDAVSGKALHTLAEHHGWVNSACFGCNDKFVFTAGNDRQVVVWNAETGQKIGKLAVQGTYLVAAASSSKVAVLEEQRSVSVLDAESGQSCYELANPKVIGMALSPDGQFLAVAGYNKLIEVHDVNKGKLLHTYAFEEGEVGSNNVWSVAFSPNGERIAASSNVFGEWNVENAQLTNQFSAPGDFIALSFSYSNDGHIAAADRTGLVRLWDCKTGKSLFTHTSHSHSTPSFVAFSPTDSHFLAVTRGKDVTIEDLSPKPLCQVLEADTREPLGAIAFDAN